MTPTGMEPATFRLVAQCINQLPYRVPRMNAAGRIISMKNCNDTIGNQTRDLPGCSAEPQTTALPRAPVNAARRISMKNSNDTNGNRTRNLPSCSAVPQPTALPRAPMNAAGRIISMKNSSDTNGNRTRDLPSCSAVPQPTALPRAPYECSRKDYINEKFQ